MHPNAAPYNSGRVASRTSSRQHPPFVAGFSSKCANAKRVIHRFHHVVDLRHYSSLITRSAYVDVSSTNEVLNRDRLAPLTLPAHRAPQTATPSAADVVLSFIEALNNRDLSSMLMMLADDCLHEDLSYDTAARSKEEVARFYADVVSSMPERVRVVVDDVTTGDPTKAGLTWHMEVDGVEVPCSRGLSFYRVRPGGWGSGGGGGGVITYVRQSPEHFVKLSGMVLSATASATPLIDSLGPMALPSFWSNLARGATNMMASAPPVDELLRNLAAAGAANVVPSMTDLIPGMAAAPGTSGGGVPGGPYGGSMRGVGGAAPTLGVFSTTAAPVAPRLVDPHPGQRTPHVVQSTFQGPTQMPGPALPGHPTYTGMSPPSAAGRAMTLPQAAPASPSFSAAAPPLTTPVAAATTPVAAAVVDSGATAACAAPIVFAASVAVAEAPPSAASIPAVSSMEASLRSSGSVSFESVDFDLLAPLVTEPAAVLAAAPAGIRPNNAVAGTSTAEEQQHQQARLQVSLPVGPSVAEAPPPPSVPLSGLAGIWEKDLEASDVDGYEKALDLWQISGVQKATAKLIEGLELAVSSGARGRGGGISAFEVHFLTIIPYFKVTESYPLGGGRAKMRRRDQRSGDSQAHAEALPNGVVCRAVWGAPFAGELEESYTLPDPAGQPDVMHVTSTIRVGGKSATTLQVYQRRRNMSARDLISASEKRNGKAHDVLKRFGM